MRGVSFLHYAEGLVWRTDLICRLLMTKCILQSASACCGVLLICFPLIMSPLIVSFIARYSSPQSGPPSYESEPTTKFNYCGHHSRRHSLVAAHMRAAAFSVISLCHFYATWWMLTLFFSFYQIKWGNCWGNDAMATVNVRRLRNVLNWTIWSKLLLFIFFFCFFHEWWPLSEIMRACVRFLFHFLLALVCL